MRLLGPLRRLATSSHPALALSRQARPEMSASGSSRSRWEWQPVVRSDLLARGFHSCNVVQGKLFIFGGLSSPDARDLPLGDVVAFDPALLTTRRLPPEWACRRSHHEAVVLDNRLLCVVGGWDGTRRVSGVCSFDVEAEKWDDWTMGSCEGAPVGLSSHTCTKLTDHEVRVVGREGGLRTQRRYASIFTLALNPATKTYRYKEEESRTASRAGHSAMLLSNGASGHKSSGYQLLVFGGRDSSNVDVAGRWGKGKIHVDPVHAPGLTAQLCHLVSGEKGSAEAPKGLRHQSCTVVGPFAVIFGGETLGKGRDAVCNDLYIHDTRLSNFEQPKVYFLWSKVPESYGSAVAVRSSGRLLAACSVPPHRSAEAAAHGCSPAKWFHFPCPDRSLKRVGHRTCLWNDKLYLVGGFGADGKTPCGEIRSLEINS